MGYGFCHEIYTQQKTSCWLLFRILHINFSTFAKQKEKQWRNSFSLINIWFLLYNCSYDTHHAALLLCQDIRNTNFSFIWTFLEQFLSRKTYSCKLFVMLYIQISRTLIVSQIMAKILLKNGMESTWF